MTITSVDHGSLVENATDSVADRFASLFSDSTVLIAGADERGNTVIFNEACERLTGLPRELAIGRSFVDVIVAPADRELVRRRLAGGDGCVVESDEVRCRSIQRERRVAWHFVRGDAPGGALWVIGIGHELQHIEAEINDR